MRIVIYNKIKVNNNVQIIHLIVESFNLKYNENIKKISVCQYFIGSLKVLIEKKNHKNYSIDFPF